MKSIFKYKEVVPIRTRTCSAWIITEPDGNKSLELWSPNATVLDVLCNRPRKSGTKVMHIDTGIFDSLPKDSFMYYSPDSREVDTDFNVSI
jgi:hypothetical protein